MQVIDRYLVNGTPECDLVDGSGVVYSGCSLLSLGGGATDRASVPPIDAEVLTVSQNGSTPYIIGVLAEVQEYRDTIELSEAGEYPLNQIGINHNELKSAGARIIAGEESLYLTPKTRIQGALEISDGAQPSQSVAIAEPTIQTLETYQARIDELRSAVINLQVALAQVVAAASLDVVAGAPNALGLVTLPTDIIQPITAPSENIPSQIAKIER